MNAATYSEIEADLCVSGIVTPWTGIVACLRERARNAATTGDNYREILWSAAMHFLKLCSAFPVAQGGAHDRNALLALPDLWTHATWRQLGGFERERVELRSLGTAFAEYSQNAEIQLPCLDWIYLDACLYELIFRWKCNLDENRLGPWELGSFVPRVASMWENSSDAQKSHSLWLEIKLSTIRSALRAAPTIITCAIGATLWFNGWRTAGFWVLAAVAFWRLGGLLGSLRRMPRRRRARRVLAKLCEAYDLLEGDVVPTPEIHILIYDAADTWGDRLSFGPIFWSVLNFVCDRHRTVLVPGSPQLL